MKTFFFLFFLLLSGTKAVDVECAIRVMQSHVQYKSFGKSGIREDAVSKHFQVFAEQRNSVQDKMVELLLLNFDLLPIVINLS